MSKALKFTWIDDTPQREKSAKNMSEALNVEIDFRGLKNKNVNEELQDILTGQEPDLILMDHSLDQADYKAIRSGSSAAAIIREKWQSCPIVSVTGTDIVDMDSRHKSAYEAIFQFTSISKNYDKIISIAKSFKALKQNNPKSVSEIFDLLLVPEGDRNKMAKILPQELKDNFSDKSLLLEIYRWCESVLFNRPGFLYDRLWVSTMLGLNTTGFKQVESKFASAKYQGVFANDSNERWWKSEVLSILGAETTEVGLPWAIGRALVEHKKSYFSKCYIKAEDYPETVAAVDTTSSAEWHPMQLKYTKPHPHYENMLFFEELRMMTPAD